MTQATKPSQGLQYKKFDLHVHTPASQDFTDKSVTADDIVNAALGKGLDGIAITDHHSGAFVDEVKAAAKGKLIVYPGVELSIANGKNRTHLIALFDISCTSEHISNFLGSLGISPEQYGHTDPIVNENAMKVARNIVDRGGLAILAHANSSNGIFSEARGQQRANIVSDRNVIGFEATDLQKSNPSDKSTADYLNGMDQNYAYRKAAVYEASDNPDSSVQREGHGINGIADRFTYFKLGKNNLEGLRQAMLDPDVRVVPATAYTEPLTYPSILDINIDSGYFSGERAQLHAGLNSILGGKGAGKSLMIELLRFVFDQRPSNPELFKDHDTKLSARLKEYGSVTVTFQDASGSTHTVKRTYDNLSNHPYDSEASEHIAKAFPILFLSQNEIIKIAEQDQEQIGFIDQFFDSSTFKGQIEAIKEELRENDSKLAEAVRAHAKAKLMRRQFDQIQAQIEQHNKKLADPVFQEHEKAQKKQSALESQKEYAQKVVSELKAARCLILDDIESPVLEAALTEDPNLKRANKAAQETRLLVESGIDQMILAAQQKVNAIQIEIDDWTKSKTQIDNNYKAKVKEKGGNFQTLAAERSRLLGQLGVVKEQLLNVRRKAEAMPRLRDERFALLERLDREHGQFSRERQAKAQLISQESQGRIDIQVQTQDDKTLFVTELGKLKKGTYITANDINELVSKTTPVKLVNEVLAWNLNQDEDRLKAYAAEISFDPELVKKLMEHLYINNTLENLLSLQYKVFPEDKPTILYKLDDETYAPLSRVSVGQKSTAMLIIALSHGDFPVLIDQPEDSLDLRSVWEDMCSKIRRGKHARQFVFTTHNSSLAVASDTDQFIILEGSSDKGRVVLSGSMDDDTIKEKVLMYLEGGEEPYKSKFYKYRFDKKIPSNQ